MDESNPMDAHQPDPLLDPGSYIDPNPPSNCNGNGNSYGNSFSAVDQSPNPNEGNKFGPVEVTDEANRPDWLPPGWIFVERTRASGASAGSKDKYFKEPVTGRLFRSKKEVMRFLETGSAPPKKRKNSDSDSSAQATPVAENSRSKKSKAKAQTYMKNFDFDDVPETVTWSLTDVYEGTWRPLINGVDRVPESTKQEWRAAFTYLTLQNENL